MTDILDRLRASLAHRYAVERELGQGGMATVYLAQDVKHHRPVAVKVLRPEVAAVIGAERFLREIDLAARLTHPYILPLHDSGEAAGLVYYVMPYVTGESLRDRLNREKQLPLEDALRIARDAAAALAYAHGQGIVHRDVKPENILLEGGEAVVADFGIARAISAAGGANLTATGIVVGTPPYMSPEQASAEPQLDGRSDIYSLGCVLYEMLAGEAPFTGPTAESVVHQHLTAPPPRVTAMRPALPLALEHAIERALAKARADRFASATQFAEALANVASGTARRAPAPEAAAAAPSVAVLPFASLSPEPENEYFGEGLAEELINALTKVKGLRVAARTSAFQFKGQHQDARKIGRELNVSTLLDGSVRRAGNRLRVTAQLINVADGYDIWSEKYERTLEDVFAIQEEIAQTIVRKLKIKLAGQQKRQLVKPHTDNVEAYKLYLQGRFFWNKRTDENFAKAKDSFERAVDEDPDYALAHAGLADAYGLLGIAEYGLLPPREAMPKAKAAALKALERDHNLAEARTTLAHVCAFYDWEWAAAESEFRRAIELDPSYPMAHHWYAIHLTAMERHDEAVREEERALELDPLSLVINKNLGTVLYYARRYDRTIAQYRKTLELDATFVRTHFYLGLVYEQKGMFEDAVAEFQNAVRLSGGNSVCLALLGHGCGIAGRGDEARRILEDLKAYSHQRYVPSLNMALVSLGLGAHDEALDWLEKACEERSSWLVFLKVEPLFDPIRGAPRFQNLVRRVGLAP